MSVAQTILQQLGGSRFRVMTGASSFSSGPDSLSFRLPAKRGYTKGGIKAVVITLDPSDTYSMKFLSQKGAPTFAVTTVKEYTDVYAEDLQRLFTEATGLYTSL